MPHEGRGRKNVKAPVWRATSVIARTVYRELRRAEYSRDEVLRFINEIIDLLTGDLAPGNATTGEIPLVDAENGFLSASATASVIDFELSRRAESASSSVFLLCLEIELPSWCAHDGAEAVHAVVAAVLRQVVRESDSVGRIDANRYVVILPQVSAAAGVAIESRMSAALDQVAAVELKVMLRASLRVRARSIFSTPAHTSASEFLEQCLLAPDRAMYPGVVHASSPPSVQVDRRRRDSLPTEKRQVVLALGGGAARALAHVGAVRVLREHGVSISGIAGTSNGALMGALLSIGMSEEAIVERSMEFAHSRLYKDMQRAFFRCRREMKSVKAPAQYFQTTNTAFLSDSRMFCISGETYEAYIEYFVGRDREISTMPIPFVGCATNIVDGRAVTLSHGSLYSALRASCAVLGLFPPQLTAGRVLVDGSILSDVPIRSALALNLKAPVLGMYLERPEPEVEKYENSISLVMRANAIAHAELVREQLAQASLLLVIPVQEIGWLNFREAKLAAEIGAEAVTRTIDELLAQIDRAAMDQTDRRTPL